MAWRGILYQKYLAVHEIEGCGETWPMSHGMGYKKKLKMAERTGTEQRIKNDSVFGIMKNDSVVSYNEE